MKNQFSLFFILFITITTCAQQIVSDPTLTTAVKTSAATQNAANKSLLAKAAATYEESAGLRKGFEASMKKLEEVNSYVATSHQVTNIKNLLTDITSLYSSGVSYVSNEKLISVSDKSKFIKVYQKMLSESLDDLKYSMNVINNGKLNMDDSARLNALDKIESKLGEKKVLISYMNSKVKTVVISKKNELANQKFINEQKIGFNKKNN
jgi:hypothetical protein